MSSCPPETRQTQSGACLQSSRNQTDQAIGLIVVDNSLHDATALIAAEIADVVLDGDRERSAERNVEARASNGAHLLFIDSDMLRRRDVARDCVTRVHAGANAIVIPETSSWHRVLGPL